MPKVSLAGFKDPVRRPRYIIWTGAVVLMLAAFVIVAIGATSTYWFCANVCHKVQDDAIAGYNASSHSEVSCMACHMPVNANPIIFIIHKAEALGELYLTVTDNFEIPLNAESHYSLELKSKQCTQCHSSNRNVTPSDGIIINHVIHEEEGVGCTLCHNRVAHNEDSPESEPKLKDPTTGEVGHKHPNFMEMTACFRCHGLEAGSDAPGACSACHPADFELKPPSHFERDFYPAGHAEMAVEEIARVEEAKAEGGEAVEEPVEEGSEESTSGSDASGFGLEAAYAEEAATEGEATEGSATPEAISAETEEAGAETDEGEGDEASEAEVEEWVEAMLELPVDQINYCSTCHLDTFCGNCHGMEMPHPTAFIEKEHPDVAKQKADKCELCHQPAKTFFCEKCHHGEKSAGWEYNAKEAWQTQHAKAVTKSGVSSCLEACHEMKFCQDCHTKLKPLPTSHKDKKWLHNELTVTNYPSEAAKPSALHAVNAQQQIEACEVCHGGGGANSKFCKGCHEYEMPHPDTFMGFHSKSGKKDADQCRFCHQIKEICSNCHHAGASTTRSWVKVHGGVVNTEGSGGCLEKCHKQDFCVDCHTGEKVVPASHDKSGWTNRAKADAPAVHTTTFGGQPDSCTYCHGGNAPNDNKFCKACHKINMPHPDDFKDTHKQSFADKQLKKSQCDTCHKAVFCNACHHPASTAKKPWVNDHPRVVKKDGAAPCFECHEETFCSYCHVREASKYID
ncbi:MAG: NapC/NirT family cytochrome c [Coriobacteriia bacterium]|nr:NapC/NirT family cytochrome c [Coriobacteriia bacterium]